jgi:hypothetical protein
VQQVDGAAAEAVAAGVVRHQPDLAALEPRELLGRENINPRPHLPDV